MQQGRVIVGDVDFVVCRYAGGVARQHTTLCAYILFCYDALIVVTPAAQCRCVLPCDDSMIVGVHVWRCDDGGCVVIERTAQRDDRSDQTIARQATMKTIRLHASSQLLSTQHRFHRWQNDEITMS